MGKLKKNFSEIVVKVKPCMEDGIGFSVWVDGDERSACDFGEWNAETYKHMCNLIAVAVFGFLDAHDYAERHKDKG